MVDMWTSESSDEDEVFVDSNLKTDSVSSVSWDEEVAEVFQCRDETGLSPVRLEVRDGRAVVVSGRKTTSTVCEQQARRVAKTAEEEICRMRYMELRGEHERLEEQVRLEETRSSRSQKRGPGPETAEEKSSSRRRTQKRRKSCEEVWFTTLAEVSGVGDFGEVEVAKTEGGERSFIADEGLKGLFDSFSEELEDCSD